LHPDGITVESTGPFALPDGSSSGFGDAVEFDGPVLAVRAGGPSGVAFPIPRTGIVTIGRSPESDIFLDDITVSRNHSQIEHRLEGLVLRDLGSLNGTYVNRRRIHDEERLQNGDEVQIGKFRLVLIDP
jgi:pSer/pThr/pTyr-binding forkhead associated (FHA) protein